MSPARFAAVGVILFATLALLALFYILSNGVVRKGMPVWSKLPEPQRWQLVSYIKSLRATVTESAPEKKP
jgi:hypothetical protein